ncbi:MAG: UvrB/UvrC motif-containing protein [Planctomycetota bacterium]
MSDDISHILRGWEYDPEEVLVRLVTGEDGRQRIQLRVDLGVLQMEIDDRPDGQRPEGFPSWLDYYEHQQREYEAKNPDSAPFLLGAEDCARLWREGVQYYHRYLSFWHLNLFDLCARDTARNLRLFGFVRAHVGDDRIKVQFDQWRPYVTMMHTRAVATPLLEARQHGPALDLIDEGIGAIRDFLDEYHQEDRASECVELVGLEQWREEILSTQKDLAETHSQSVVQVLRQRMERAIAAEEFEEAARLRDEIRRLTSGAPE